MKYYIVIRMKSQEDDSEVFLILGLDISLRLAIYTISHLCLDDSQLLSFI